MAAAVQLKSRLVPPTRTRVRPDDVLARSARLANTTQTLGVLMMSSAVQDSQEPTKSWCERNKRFPTVHMREKPDEVIFAAIAIVGSDYA